jgi:hypothetical protein
MQKYLFAAFLALIPTIGWGQVRPSATVSTNNIYGYALFAASRPNYRSEWITGPSFGAYKQWSPFVGLDIRGDAFRWGPSSDHQYLAVAGPRLAFNKQNWSFYLSAGGGIGHARYDSTSSFAGSWLLDGGLDYKLNPRIKLRTCDFSYGYIGVLQHGLNPKTIAVGIVVRID